VDQCEREVGRCQEEANPLIQVTSSCVRRVYSHLTRELAVAVYHGEMGEAPRRDEQQLKEEELRGSRHDPEVQKG